MTRKDYIRLAEAIAEARRIVNAREGLNKIDSLDIVQTEIARALKADNAAFSRERFIAACEQ